MRFDRSLGLLLLPAGFALGLLAACGDDGDSGLVIRIPDAGSVDGGVDAGPARVCTAESAGSTIGASCLNDAACDDGCFCNGREVCRGGVCDLGPVPCEDDFPCTTGTCDEATDRCTVALDDLACDDGNACNGTEICDPEIGCAAGPDVRCSDGDPCTLDTCDDATGACAFPVRDLDGDGFGDGARGCGGLDCDDNPLTGGAVNPGVVEDCTNEIDDDCDRLIDFADDTCNPTNDSCEDAVEIASSGDSLFWKSAGLTNAFDLGCDSTTGLDVYDAVFAFTLTEPANVVARISGGGTGQTIALRAAATCGDDAAGELACDPGTTTSPGAIEYRNAPAGDYVLIASVRTETFFTVTLELGPATPPPPTDTCDPVDTPLIPVDMESTFTGVWSNHENDFASPACANVTTGGIDVVYRLSLAEAKDVRLSANGTSNAAGTSRTRTALYVIEDCADTATVSACSEGSSSATTGVFSRPLPAGEYFVVVEKAFSGTTGTWELIADVRDPVPRATADVCDTAPDITGSSRTIDIATLERDGGLGCDGGSSLWKEAYFLVSLAAASDVTVETNGDGLHLVSFSNGACGDTTSDLLCRASTSTATEVFRNLPAGDYYVTVGTARAAGEITASATLSAPTPPPSNDTCAGARAVTSGSTIAVSGVGATDTVDLTCGGTAGLDLWYELTLAADATVVLTLEAADDDDVDGVALELFGACGDTPIVCASGDAPAITRSLTAGTYRVAVESLGRGERDLTLRVVTL